MTRTAAFLVAAACLAACSRPAPTTAQTLDAGRSSEAADENRQSKPLPDTSLIAIVKSALVSESGLDANRIDIENKAGNIALYGSVDTPAQRDKAERIVNSVGGVKTVANYLSVNERNAGEGNTSPHGQ
jgi:osmotically-inducible protein OsmY